MAARSLGRIVRSGLAVGLCHGNRPIVVGACALVAHSLAYVESEEVGGRHIRKSIDNHFGIGESILKAPALLVDHGAVEERPIILAPGERHHPVEIGHGAVVVAHLGAEDSAVEDGRSVDRIELESIIKVAHRPIIVVELMAQIGTVNKKRRLTRLKADGLVHVGESRRKSILTLLHGQIGMKYQGAHIEAVDVESFVDIGLSPYGVALVEEQIGIAHVGALIARRELEEALESHLGTVGQPGILLCHGEIKHHPLVDRHHVEHLAVVGDRALKIARVLPRHPAYLIRIGDKRVAVDGERGIGLGSPHIVERVFGHSAVKIGLGKIGLGRNGLIEILYGEHIVLEIERVAPNPDHLVNIDLRIPWGQSGQSCAKGCDDATNVHVSN